MESPNINVCVEKHLMNIFLELGNKQNYENIVKFMDVFFSLPKLYRLLYLARM